MNDIETMEFLGRQASRNATFLDHMCYSFGEDYFSGLKVAQRMEFLQHEHHDITKDTLELMSGYVAISYGECTAIQDLSDSYRGLDIALIIGAEDGQVFSIRQYDSDYQEPEEMIGTTVTSSGHEYAKVVEDSENHWNFTINSTGNIDIFKPSNAFLNLHETRAVANLIVWTSNVLGFGKKALTT